MKKGENIVNNTDGAGNNDSDCYQPLCILHSSGFYKLYEGKVSNHTSPHCLATGGI